MLSEDPDKFGERRTQRYQKQQQISSGIRRDNNREESGFMVVNRESSSQFKELKNSLSSQDGVRGAA